MKDDIRNIINLENITRVRSSISVATALPSKNSIVKLIPIQYLERGVKVLIDGKLFIAFIDGKIPIKEEIIAHVTSVNPFSLNLNLSTQVENSEDFLIDQIIKIFGLKNSNPIRATILKVVKEGNILIKSKIIQLFKLTRFIKGDGIEFSLLINLVWNNSEDNNKYIEELYESLFDESFEEVCNNLFRSVNDLLFSEISQFLSQQISESLIYIEESQNVQAILNKTDSVLKIIKLLNDQDKLKNYNHNEEVTNFIKYGTKYILQKSVLKEYDYYPDFVLVKRDTQLTVIHYSIKKIINNSNNTSYKIVFKNDSLPFTLSGIIRDNFLHGNLKINEALAEGETITSLEESLFNHWGFRSAITVNNEDNNYHMSKINSEVNKLIS